MKCQQNLVKDFRTTLNFPCGDRIEALKIGREILEKHNPESSSDVVDYVKRKLLQIEEDDRRCKDIGGQELDVLFENFEAALKFPCGERDQAIRIGKLFIEKAQYEILNSDVVNYVELQITLLEELEVNCESNKSQDSLNTIYEKFKTARREKCGERAAAINLGQIIYDRFGEKSAVARYVKESADTLKKWEKDCQKKAE